jgi:hypothetical protein
MKIEGYEVMCFGIRYKHQKGARALKLCCRECTLYRRYHRHIKPAWTAMGFIPETQSKCKIKELYGRQQE